MSKLVNNKIEAIKGDITQIETDAIVNAENSALKGGGGVDGAIHRAGGPEILEECKTIVAKNGKLPAGEAVITNGGALKAKYVIHTPGPVWQGGHKNEPVELANSYHNSLKVAEENNCKTVAFPNISTGVYGFPKDKAAAIAVKTIREYIKKTTSIQKVYLVCFDNENYEWVQKNL